MAEYFETLARYNRWANGRLYAAAAALSDAEYRADRGAYFSSVHGTLNHVLVADRIWPKRITGEGDAPGRLDVILCDALDELEAARACEDDRIADVVAAQNDASLAATLRYANMSGREFEQSLWWVFAHLFNHQTHHRGQAHALIGQLGHEPPELDLVFFLRG